jgi:large subunit ribosomal protein L22
MPVTARLRYLRIAPRKVRLITDLIKGKEVKEAEAVLRFTVKKAARPLLKLLKSAVASAINDFQLEESNLYVSKISVDKGPTLKRWRARSRGQAFEIQKKTSHVTVVLDEIKKKPKKTKPKKKIKPKKKEKVGKKKAKPKMPKFKPEIEIEKPKTKKGLKRIFRRKAF